MCDELVKRLRYCSEEQNGCGMCALSSDCVLRIGLLTQAADVIEELTGFVQEAERDRDEYRDRLDKSNDAIEELQQTVKHYKGCSDDWYREACDYKAMLPRWITVTERLPEEDGWYQVYAPGYSGGSSTGLKNINGNMYSAFKHGKWSIEVGYHKRPGCVKAWMPLPEPPKEEN